MWFGSNADETCDRTRKLNEHVPAKQTLSQRSSSHACTAEVGVVDYDFKCPKCGAIARERSRAHDPATDRIFILLQCDACEAVWMQPKEVPK
jgi:hypothetical protein